MKGMAEKIHRLGGYRVLVPDLYKGEVGVDKEEAQHVCAQPRFDTAAIFGGS